MKYNAAGAIGAVAYIMLRFLNLPIILIVGAGSATLGSVLGNTWYWNTRYGRRLS